MKVAFLFFLIFLAEVPGFSAPAAMESIETTVQKRAAVDQKKYRSLTLPNELRAYLISDPNAPQCSASMNVAIGNMADPRDMLGLAHYLEHVLFMGTEKFPVTGEYNEYIDNNQGMTNAYTSTTDTNYMFQINANAYEGALDRFSQFFVAPKFDAGFLEKEKNAVQSEYDKNIQNDGWRGFQMLKTVMLPDHPTSQFSIGSLDTLKNVSREKVLKFYQDHYSANLMTLALYCRSSLDEMETYAKKYFSDVPNKDLDKVTYASDIIDQDTLPLKISYKPVKEERKVTYTFVMPPTKAYYKTKPLRILQYLLGREGQGSLLALLKEKGWAIALGASGWEENYATLFSVEVELTPAGEEKMDEVSDLFFSYMNMIKKEGYPEHVFELQSTMMRNEFVFAETDAPVTLAIYYATSMVDHPADQVDINNNLLHEYSQDDFAKVLGYVNPDKVIIFHSSPTAKTDSKEKFFGIDFRKEKVAEKTWKKWQDQPVDKLFSYPVQNRYLPTDLNLQKKSADVAPKQIDSVPGSRIWFLNDGRFPVPKAQVGILMTSPVVGENVDGNVKTELWVNMLNDHLMTWRDELNEVGISLGFEMLPNGVLLRAGGFSQHLPRVIDEAIQKAAAYQPAENRFQDLKETMRKDLDNLEFTDPYRVAVDNLKALEQKSLFRFPERLGALRKVTFKEIKAQKDELFAAMGIQALAYGNLSAAAIETSIARIPDALRVKTRLAPDRQPEEIYLLGEKGSRLALVSDTKNNNSAWASKVIFGKKSAAVDAMATVLGAHWEPKYFGDLRDKKQLGYVVHAGSSLQGKSSGFIFLLQSQKYTSDELAQYSRDWVNEQLKGLKQLDDETFNKLRDAAIQKIEQPESNMQERYDRFWNEIRTAGADFQYRQELVTALKALEKKKFVADVTQVFSDKGAVTNSSYIAPKNVARPKTQKNETVVTNLEQTKTSLKNL